MNVIGAASGIPISAPDGRNGSRLRKMQKVTAMGDNEHSKTSRLLREYLKEGEAKRVVFITD